MRVLVMVKATPSSEQGIMPPEQLFADMNKFNAELVEARIMLAGEGLKPSSQGVRVRFDGKKRQVFDGPFIETNELVAGYWLWQVDSMQQAIDWVKRCPNPMPEISEIEIRPLYELDDFAALDPTGELRREEEMLQQKIALGKATATPYLFYSGRCEEALEFYRTKIDAVIGMVMKFSDSPEPMPPGMLPAGFESKIMHCEFTVGKTTIFASDGCGEVCKVEGFRLALTVPTEADADRVFNGLAEGGKVDMPLEKTFWSPRYGQVTDKFGLGWMVMVPGAPQ